MTNLIYVWTELKLLAGRVVCRWKGHSWAFAGLPVQRRGHRGGFASTVCVRCEERQNWELSPAQLVEAKRVYREASKLRLVR